MNGVNSSPRSHLEKLVESRFRKKKSEDLVMLYQLSYQDLMRKVVGSYCVSEFCVLLSLIHQGSSIDTHHMVSPMPGLIVYSR